MSESRLHKSYLNARVNVFFYLVTLFISFFSRKIFLEKLGADFVGLTSTMQNLLAFSIWRSWASELPSAMCFTNRFSTEIGTG